MRVANLLPYVVLKIFAFQDRHENKDAYDLVFCILNFGEGPDHAGAGERSEPRRPPRAEVHEALDLLAERFETVDHDGPAAYGTFLADPGDDEEKARLRQEAVVEPSASSSVASASNRPTVLLEESQREWRCQPSTSSAGRGSSAGWPEPSSDFLSGG